MKKLVIPFVFLCILIFSVSCSPVVPTKDEYVRILSSKGISVTDLTEDYRDIYVDEDTTGDTAAYSYCEAYLEGSGNGISVEIVIFDTENEAKSAYQRKALELDSLSISEKINEKQGRYGGYYEMLTDSGDGYLVMASCKSVLILISCNFGKSDMAKELMGELTDGARY